MELGKYTGSLVFQHNYGFFLNEILRNAFRDKMTHVAVINDRNVNDLNDNPKIINAAFQGIIEDKLSTVIIPTAEVEVWLPKLEYFPEVVINEALTITEKKALGQPYGYFQLMSYIPYFYLRNIFPWMKNPITDGMWCSEYMDIYLNSMNWDPVPNYDENATRPNEIYDAVVKSGKFIKVAEKKNGESQLTVLY